MSDDPGYDFAEKAFLKAFGSALMNWSYVEHRLLLWFWHLSGMTEGAARAVYFSGRSFKARSEMIQSILRCDEFPKKLQRQDTHLPGLEFVQDAINKADAYCGFRNSLAHGVGINHHFGNYRVLKVQTGALEYSKAMASAIGFEKVSTASMNFETLSLLIAQGYYVVSRQTHNLEQLQELHARLLLLPNQPDCEKLSQNQLGRQRQREAARRKASKTALRPLDADQR